MAKSQSNRRGGSRRSSSSSAIFDIAKERPVATAAAAAGAVAAGVFLWSKRAQISDQLSQLSEQIGEFTGGGNRELETVGGETKFSGSTATGTAAEIGGTTIRNRRGTTAGGRRKSSSGDGGSLSAGNTGAGRA